MSQMVSEYMRLESRLAGMAIGAEGADHDEVRLRLEIMMSQIELLQEGDLGKFINKSEQRKTVVATLIRNLHLLDKQVDTMTPEQVRQILPVLSELDGPLTSMAAATLTQDINIVNITHDKIQHLYYIYSVISILLIAMCITLGLLMLRQNNNLRRAHVRMKTLANDLQASKEKLQVQNRRLQYDAYHDSLTGMPNRLSFWQRLQEIVNQVRPYKGCAVVMLFDLDSFKDVNDTLGHDAGDKLLQDLASRLSFFRKTSETLYRLGGDEFAMLSYDLTEEMALERANVIREKISQPYQIYDAQINIDACIGIVISDGESRTDYLYKCADLALYEAKKRVAAMCKSSGRGCCSACRRTNRLKTICCRPWPMTNSKSTISRSLIPSRAKSTAMKRWFAGSIRCAAPCRRRCLFRWQRKSVLLMPLANGC